MVESLSPDVVFLGSFRLLSVGRLKAHNSEWPPADPISHLASVVT